jgi:hypothetical protein
MLRPLDEDSFPVATALLAEGFPERTRAFWSEGLRRLHRYGGNTACGVPMGQLLFVGGEAVGVALTPASPRHRPDGRRRNLVNVSSWYVREKHRWRAPLMLRSLLADPDASYTDLTPVPQVEPILLASGFRPVSHGTLVAALPMCAIASSGRARVRELMPDDPLPPAAPPIDILLAHRDLGCVPLLMDHGGGQTLLVYRRQLVRRMPAARLTYIGSHRALQQHLPALARHLLARGILFLSWDARGARISRAGISLRHWGHWYAKGEFDEDCTDFIGSELYILGV